MRYQNAGEIKGVIEGREWDGMVVLCAANNYDGIKLADQHMAEELSRLRPVLYVDPPVSFLTPRKHPYVATSLAGPRLRMQSAALPLWFCPFPHGAE
jgi:hypothetical protein